MDIFECIETKRSVRRYTDEPVKTADMDRLIRLGTMASTAAGMEPWGFLVLKDKLEIDCLSEEIKVSLRESLPDYPAFQQYESWLINPKFHVFNNAHTVLAIYGDTASRWNVYDGTLAAGNIMLAAHAMGIGTCWIGFAEQWMDTPAFKQAHKVPAEFQLVSPLSMGYKTQEMAPPTRKEPRRF